MDSSIPEYTSLKKILILTHSYRVFSNYTPTPCVYILCVLNVNVPDERRRTEKMMLSEVVSSLKTDDIQLRATAAQY